jgi:hypothetical protein
VTRINALAPQSFGGSGSALVLEATTPMTRPLMDAADRRTGKPADPFGHIWFTRAY